MKNIKSLGADPEVFLVNEKTGEDVPAYVILPGTHKQHHKEIGDGVTVHADNVMCEFNIPVSTSTPEFQRNIHSAKDSFNAYVNSLEYPHNYTVMVSGCSREYTPELLDHYQAKEIGCEPDFNAYSGEINPTLACSLLGNNRFAGGHVHIAFNDGVLNEKQDYLDVVKSLDLILYPVDCIFAVKNNKTYHEQMIRKLFYGKRGSFRPKPGYPGVEYRTLSNEWFMNSQAMDYLIWALEVFDSNPFLSRSDYIKEDEFQEEYELIISMKHMFSLKDYLRSIERYAAA